MKGSAAVAINTRVTFKSTMYKRQKKVIRRLVSVYENYHLRTYTTKYVVAEPDGDMTRLIKSWNSLPNKYMEAFWNKTLRCHREFDEYVLEGSFMND